MYIKCQRAKHSREKLKWSKKRKRKGETLALSLKITSRHRRFFCRNSCTSILPSSCLNRLQLVSGFHYENCLKGSAPPDGHWIFLSTCLKSLLVSRHITPVMWRATSQTTYPGSPINISDRLFFPPHSSYSTTLHCGVLLFFSIVNRTQNNTKQKNVSNALLGFLMAIATHPILSFASFSPTTK